MLAGLKKSKGFGLIEVMIAVAIIAGLGLVVSQFVFSQSKQQTNIRSSSACEARLSSIISKIKEMDNNNNVTPWMPRSSEPLPTDENIRARLRQDIIQGYTEGTVGEVLGLAADINHSSFPDAQSRVARLANNYQLIASASSILSALYENACNAPIEATNLPEGELKKLLRDELGGLAGISLRVNRSSNSGPQPCDSDWAPIPINVNANANTNSSTLLGLTITASYVDELDSSQHSCTASATFSPGSDLVVPGIAVNVTHSLNAVGDVLCGTGTSTSFGLTINQGANPEVGVQYLCRLDYIAGNAATLPNRTNGTGWFVCSMPEASIQRVETTIGTPATRLTVSGFSMPGGNSVQFTVGNAREGTYKLHVKSIDVARNESAVHTETIRIDLSRPTLDIAVPVQYTNETGFPANTYRFQCNSAHSPWVVAPATGYSETVGVGSVSFNQGYWNTNNPSTPSFTNFTCTGTNVNLPATLTDGPKRARFAVCDVCNAGMAIGASGGPAIQDELWFVDTQANINPGLASFSSGSLHYDAGINDGNPYVLSHRTISAVAHTTSTLNPTTYEVRNAYDTTTHVLSNGAVNFPPQPAIAACNTYGLYSYTAKEGCNQPIRTWSGAYTGPGSSGTNPVYCPSFDTPVAPAGTCGPTMVNCPVNLVGGYSGNRSGSPAQPDCTYYPAPRHLACARPTCLPGYRLLENVPPAPYAAHHFKCATCDGSTEIIREPVENGSAQIASIPNGCPGCSEPPCFNYAQCWALRKCLTGDAAQDAPRNVSAAGGGMTSACGQSASMLVCAADPLENHFAYRYYRDDPMPEPESLFPQMAGRVACACTNGAINYPTCNTCSAGSTYDGTNCVLNPSAACGVSGNLSDASQISPACSSGTVSGNISFTISTGNWNWTCQEPPSSTVACSAHLQCAHGFTYNNTTGNCPPSSCTSSANCAAGYSCSGGVCTINCTSNADCASGYTCVSGVCSNGGPPPGGGGGGCFIAGTPVMMENGEQKAIEDIVVGDRVVSMDERYGNADGIGSDEVVEVLHHEMALQHLFKFELANGATFTANDVHPIFIESKNEYLKVKDIYNQWLAQKDLKLATIDGESVAIKNIIYSYEFVMVYNLHVKGKGEENPWKYGAPAGHNYYVNGVLVHNANGRQLLSPQMGDGDSPIVKN